MLASIPKFDVSRILAASRRREGVRHRLGPLLRQTGCNALLRPLASDSFVSAACDLRKPVRLSGQGKTENSCLVGVPLR